MISNHFAGVLHENHKALIARGPWTFLGIEPARYEARPAEGGGTVEAPVCSGTCAICGQGICDVVRIRQRVTGEELIIGLDCAGTMADNLGKAFRDAKTGLMRVKRAATTRRKAEKLADVLAPLRAEMTAWSTEDTFRANVARNALRVMDKGRRPSEAHMALIEKLRAEEPRQIVKRAPRAEEIKVRAPEGKQTIRGVVVSTKCEDLMFGRAARTVYKMTVKVTTDDGVFLVFGTVPTSLLDATGEHLECPEGRLPALKGCVVEFSADLTRSDRDEFFAFASRPSKARLVSWPEGAERKPLPWEQGTAETEVDPFEMFAA